MFPPIEGSFSQVLSMAESISIAEIGNVASLVLLIGVVVLLLFYIWLGLRDLIVIARNFNYERAEICRWKKCGLYLYDETSRTK